MTSLSKFIIETGEITFAYGVTSMSVNFCGGFSVAPVVTLTQIPVSADENMASNSNAFVDSITNTNMTVKISGNFIGTVYYQAIQYY